MTPSSGEIETHDVILGAERRQKGERYVQIAGGGQRRVDTQRTCEGRGTDFPRCNRWESGANATTKGDLTGQEGRMPAPRGTCQLPQ